MFSYFWPIALVVFANTFYQICAKDVPDAVSPFASLTITYLTGAAASAVLYFLLTKEPNLLREYSHLNWASFGLGIVIVGLEVGFIYAYKAGWQVSTAATVQSAFLAIVLIFVGLLLYHEAITWNKVIGILLCLVGIIFINQ